MRYDPARQELVLKVVYYGPGLAGKTTNLQFLHGQVPEGRASDLVSIDTHSERTLHFDFVALELGAVQGLDIRLEFYTVPGQSYYAATRRQVLAGADGVVFVADSRREALDENIDAMNEMLGNLRHHGLPEDLPIVLQYNKQDLATAVPVEQLHLLLNIRGWPSFPAVATTGEGVGETCEALVRILAERMANIELPLMLGSSPSVSPSVSPVVQAQPEIKAPASWLITCYRCQSMLDVPSARPGEIYTCGVCHSQLAIVDPDRGTTQAPQAQAQPPGSGTHQRPATGSHLRTGSRPSANYEADIFQIPDSGIGAGSGGGYDHGALKPATGTISRPGYLVAAGEFPLAGFTVLGILDENPQGRRVRVREQATGKTFRALVLAPSLVVQSGYRDSVEPYARMTGPIKHPNLLHLASLRVVPGQDPDQVVYLSADPGEHEPLSHVLARRRALAPPQALAILRQITLALEESARHGAIHGWLRPDVILINAEGAVLVDELCVLPSHRFLTRELAGVSAATEYYLAPEYLNDDLRGDIRADIFLLGALLFRMITGDGLVTGYNAVEALHKLNTNGPRLLRDAQQGISRELNNFYLKLVAVDRSQRFQTYGDVLDALDRFGGRARRQNGQLTSHTYRPPANSPNRAASTGVQSGRRGGTGPLPPAPRNRTTDPSGGHAVLPSRRKRSSSVSLLIAVVVVLALAIAVLAMVMSRPRGPVAHESMVDPMPAVPVSAADPAPAVNSATLAGSTGSVAGNSVSAANAERLESRRALADQLVGEKWSAALETAQGLADPFEQRAAEAQVRSRHEARKRDIEGMLKSGVEVQAVRQALESFRGSFRLPGDLEWVIAVQSRIDTRDISEPSPDAATTAALDQPAPALSAAEIPLAVDAYATALGSVLRAFATDQPAQAAAALAGLPAASAATVALRQLISWWPARIQLLNRVAATKAVKLRFEHPTTGETVDLVAADAAGIAVAASNGSSSALSWGQVPAKALGKLLANAASAPGASTEELGGAVGGLLVADEPALAGVVGKRGKVALADKAAQVEAVIELYHRRTILLILNKGFEALRAGNVKAANEALVEVRKVDKTLQKSFESEIARLETAATAPAAGAVERVPGMPGADGPPKDLKERQAALRTLGWEPVGDAWLDGTSVHLSPNAGISFEMTRGVAGFSLAASGEGYLRLIPTRSQNGSIPKGGIPLPLAADHTTNYTVTFSREGMTVLDAMGLVIQTLPLSAPPTLFLVISTADATLATVPKPIIQ
jgi:signal recognition particle receptor subunit beta/serine/threonine protein kinase